jgi:hypothetical protein
MGKIEGRIKRITREDKRYGICLCGKNAVDEEGNWFNGKGSLGDEFKEGNLVEIEYDEVQGKKKVFKNIKSIITPVAQVKMGEEPKQQTTIPTPKPTKEPEAIIKPMVIHVPDTSKMRELSVQEMIERRAGALIIAKPMAIKVFKEYMESGIPVGPELLQTILGILVIGTDRRTFIREEKD